MPELVSDLIILPFSSTWLTITVPFLPITVLSNVLFSTKIIAERPGIETFPLTVPNDSVPALVSFAITTQLPSIYILVELELTLNKQAILFHSPCVLFVKVYPIAVFPEVFNQLILLPAEVVGSLNAEKFFLISINPL